MGKIYFVTTNKAKFLSAERRLSPHGIELVLVNAAIDEPEYTNSSKEIVKAKCVFALGKVPGPVICEDGGFFVNALGGEPGVKAHGYLAAKNNEGLKGAEKLLVEIKDSDDRGAYFFSVAGYMEAGWEEPVYFSSKVEGKISHELRGPAQERNWSSIHRVFIPRGSGKTLAEMDDDEYEEFSKKISVFMKLERYLTKAKEI